MYPSGCPSRINTDLTSQDHTITQESLSELKKSIEGTKEDLEDQLDQVRDAIGSAAASLRDQLSADQARLQSSLDSLAHAQRVAETTLPQVIIKGNRGGAESRTLFGTDASRPQFSLNASDNIAEQGAVMAAGVHSPETLKALLGESGAADLVLALRSLHTQSHGTSTETPQSVPNGSSTGRTPGIIIGPSNTNAIQRLRISGPEDTSSDVEPSPNTSNAVHVHDRKYDEAIG